jgi:hypothetical protein
MKVPVGSARSIEIRIEITGRKYPFHKTTAIADQNIERNVIMLKIGEKELIGEVVEGHRTVDYISD